MKRHHRLLAVFSLFALSAPAALAENFRCGQWIASPDMSVGELLGKCGAPDSKTVTEEDVYGPSASGKGRVKVGTTITEVWTYNRGSQASAMIVTIVDGEIRSMERGEQ